MAKYEKKMIDTRTFTEIYGSLTLAEQHYIQDKVIRDTEVAASAFRNWTCGYRRPLPVYQKAIMRTLKKLDIVTSTKTLFPSNT